MSTINSYEMTGWSTSMSRMMVAVGLKVVGNPVSVSKVSSLSLSAPVSMIALHRVASSNMADSV